MTLTPSSTSIASRTVSALVPAPTRARRVIGSLARERVFSKSFRLVPEVLLLSALASSPVSGATVFPDHQDPRRLYYLPPSLAVARASEGDPDFFLLRYRGDFALAQGGFLRFVLTFMDPA